MNVTAIKNGLVIDHIRAGTGWRIFRRLGLDASSFTSALIMNVPSQKSGKKDLIKIDNIIDIDFSVLGFIDPDICVNIIKDEKVVRKINMTLPPRVQNIFRCKNPRCITGSENFVPSTFLLVDRAKRLYRCEYCDALYTAGEDGNPVEAKS
ncbi:MAG: aspartate carbamoyltransferase regulatory subunit [Treponema socranskii subsp. buccale]